MGFEKNDKELKNIKQLIMNAHPDILAVSLGSPKGEKFIYKYLKEYGVSLGISIGATIDFEAGNIKRAPKWMSNAGLEWLFRITQDPGRLIKRYWKDAVSIIPIYKKYKGGNN
jgi:exopolysaccharide biosynthesis WecB/TagA/CpsF family protein